MREVSKKICLPCIFSHGRKVPEITLHQKPRKREASAGSIQVSRISTFIKETPTTTTTTSPCIRGQCRDTALHNQKAALARHRTCRDLGLPAPGTLRSEARGRSPPTVMFSDSSLSALTRQPSPLPLSAAATDRAPHTCVRRCNPGPARAAPASGLSPCASWLL